MEKITRAEKMDSHLISQERTVNHMFHVKREGRNGLKVSIDKTPDGWTIDVQTPEYCGPVIDKEYRDMLYATVGDKADAIMDEACYQLQKSIIKELLF